MSQISMPIRIVLVAAVVFLAAWFTVLKPGSTDEITDPGAALSSEAGEFQDAARAGAAAAEKDAAGAANATLEDDGTAPATAAPGAAPTTAAPSGTVTGTASATQAAPPPAPLTGKAAERLPAPIRAALDDRKVLVLGVLNTASKPWAPMADDDRRVRNTLKRVNRYRGEVAVHTAPVGELARYEGLLNALAVSQTPTIVIVDRNRRATALAGYWDRVSLNQAIVDARRSSTDKLIKDKYLAQVNRECARSDMRIERLALPGSRRRFPAYVSRVTRVAGVYASRVAALPAPARWRPLKGQMQAAFRNQAGYARQLGAAVAAGDGASVRRTVAASRADSRKLDRRLNAVGLTSCTSVRTQ